MKKIRLQKYLSSMGVDSRRNCEKLICAGKVKVNYAVITKLGTTIDPDKDIIEVNKKVITKNNYKLYILLYKPRGFLCTSSDPFGRQTIYDLLKKIKIKLNYAGRLDFDSEGLVFLTNDGDIINEIIHPRRMVTKIYEVKIKGIPKIDDISMLQKGVPITSQITTQPCHIKILKKNQNNSILHISISEGKNRQIRRMFDYLGIKVLRLKRIQIANLTIDGLKPGEYRILENKEIVSLKKYIKNNC